MSFSSDEEDFLGFPEESFDDSIYFSVQKNEQEKFTSVVMMEEPKRLSTDSGISSLHADVVEMSSNKRVGKTRKKSRKIRVPRKMTQDLKNLPDKVHDFNGNIIEAKDLQVNPVVVMQRLSTLDINSIIEQIKTKSKPKEMKKNQKPKSP